MALLTEGGRLVEGLSQDALPLLSQDDLLLLEAFSRCQCVRVCACVCIS
jgi:hypothetical protein